MSLGPTELILILVIVIILFGVGRISKIGKEMGSGIRGFRDGLQGDDRVVPWRAIVARGQDVHVRSGEAGSRRLTSRAWGNAARPRERFGAITQRPAAPWPQAVAVSWETEIDAQSDEPISPGRRARRVARSAPLLASRPSAPKREARRPASIPKTLEDLPP